MQLHPTFMTALMAERERGLRRRAELSRLRARRKRPVRSAPWPP